MFSRLTKIQRLSILISITSSFFVAELSGESAGLNLRMLLTRDTNEVGFHSRSLALVADAFHYVCEISKHCPKNLLTQCAR